jgi:hypothetical protein
LYQARLNIFDTPKTTAKPPPSEHNTNKRYKSIYPIVIRDLSQPMVADAETSKTVLHPKSLTFDFTGFIAGQCFRIQIKDT